MKPCVGARLAALAAVLVLVVLAGWSLRSQQRAGSAPAMAMAATGANNPLPAATPVNAGTGEQPVTGGTAALPPPDAPLAQILPALVRRADAGDGKAACRLAMELIRCTQVADWASISMPKNDEHQQETDPALDEYWDQRRLWQLERQMQCRGVPASLRDRGSHYLVQAAHAGEPEAMVRYAEGGHWPPSGRGIVADPGFDAWRRDAAAMMYRALAAGAPEAVQLLMINYSDDFGLLSALVPDDPEQALAMHLLSARLFGTSESPHKSRNLSAGAVVRARERAEQMHERYFQNRRLPSERGRLYPTFFPPPTAAQPRFCENE